MLFEDAMIYYSAGIWFAAVTYIIVTDCKGPRFWQLPARIRHKPNLAVTTIFAGLALACMEQSLIISLV